MNKLLILFLFSIIASVNPLYCELYPNSSRGSSSSQGTFASLSLITGPQTVVVGNPLIFDNTNLIQGNISYNSTTGEITLSDEGFYSVVTAATVNNDNAIFCLQLNGSSLTGGCFSGLPGTQGPGIVGIIIQATANSTLKMTNTNLTADVYEGFLIIQKI